MDTNSLFLTRQLNEIGIPVMMKSIVGDDEMYLEQAVRGSLDRTPLLITIGGHIVFSRAETADGNKQWCAVEAAADGLLEVHLVVAYN